MKTVRNQADKKTIMVIAPYWRHAGHVGNYRVDMYTRWLSEAGHSIVIVRAGSRDDVETTKLGYEITIRDPLNLYPDVDTLQSAKNTRRKPNRYRRKLAYLLLNPDPSIVWARRAVRHPLVERYSKDVICVLSSSPPESIHIASAQIAERLGVTLCIDMRDGWLDEPLKPLLQQHGLQRWREGRLERRVLTRADKIIVTSPIWKELLGSRLGFTGKKTVLVTNAYPLIESDRGNEEDLDSTKRSATAPRPIHLVHAGRFTSSRYTQKPGYIFKLLDGAIERWGNGGVITLLGDLESEERKEIGSWRTSFQDKGWTLKFERSVPREQMLTTLRRADGLLLLSIARAAIPCKLFEYIPARKPILAVTSENSAVWCVGGGVPQMFLASYETPLDSTNVVVRFLEACRTGNYAADAPDIYSEVYLKNVFMNEVATGFAVSGAPHQR